MTEKKQEAAEEKQDSREETPRSDRASKLMNDMMKGLREFGSSAMEKAEEFGKIASDKAEELTKQGKLKLDVHQLQRSRTKLLAELGELVINLKTKPKIAKLTEHESYQSLTKSIKEIDAAIKEKEALADEVVSEDSQKGAKGGK